MIQFLTVSCAAPLATLTVMEQDRIALRQIATTLAMIFTISQANVIFPLVAVGIDLGVIVVISLIGGLVAASLTYYLLTRSLSAEESATADSMSSQTGQSKRPP